jgi:hypothetical protein
LAGSPRVLAEEPFADAAREMIDLSNVYVRFKVRVLGLVSIVGALIDCSGRSQTIRKAIRQPYACR